MKIEQQRSEAQLTVKPFGRLDSVTSDDFLTFLKQNFQESDRQLIIDFAEVDFISSKGLRVLITVYKELNGRSMSIVNANASVLEVFRLSGLLKIFNLQ